MSFSLSNVSFVQSFLLSEHIPRPEAIAFNNDGTKMLISGSKSSPATAQVFEYTLPTPYSLNTVDFIQSKAALHTINNLRGLTFSPDGLLMFVVDGPPGFIYTYNLATPFSLTTVGFVHHNSISDQDRAPTGIAFSPDGTKMFMSGTLNDRIYEYTLSSPFVVSSRTFIQSFLSLDQDILTFDVTFSSDGLKMFMTGAGNRRIYEYTLASPFSLTTVAFVQSALVDGQDTSPQGMAFNDDGTKMFMVGGRNNRVYEYTLGLALPPPEPPTTGGGVESDIQKLDPGAIVELFELDASNIGGDINRFHAGTNELVTPVVWKGDTYQPFPIEADGFELGTVGPIPRPKVIISNVSGIVGALVRDTNDLVGAKVTRRRTFVRYLDAVNFTGGVNPKADPNISFSDEIYFISRKVLENKVQIEFELQSSMDVEGKLLPGRQIVANVCQWIYRGPECGFSGGAVAELNDTPTNILALDRCGQRVSSCKLRFGENSQLPFGSFPGANIR